MVTSLPHLQGKKVVSIDYHHRCQWFSFETAEGELLRFEAYNDAPDEFGKSMTYFTNFSNFDVLAIRAKEVGVTFSGAVSVDNTFSNIEHVTLFSDKGLFRFACVNRNDGGTGKFGWTIESYKKA